MRGKREKRKARESESLDLYQSQDSFLAFPFSHLFPFFLFLQSVPFAEQAPRFLRREVPFQNASQHRLTFGIGVDRIAFEEIQRLTGPANALAPNKLHVEELGLEFVGERFQLGGVLLLLAGVEPLAASRRRRPGSPRRRDRSSEGTRQGLAARICFMHSRVEATSRRRLMPPTITSA